MAKNAITTPRTFFCTQKNNLTRSDSKSQYYTTVSNPVKPVRTFTPAFKFVPQTQVDYLEFNYGADPKAFFIPQDCQ